MPRPTTRLSQLARPLLTALAIVAGAFPPMPGAYADTARHLVWSDEFNGTSVDRRCWTPETTRPGNNWDEMQRFTASPTNLYERGGTLTIAAHQRVTGVGKARRQYTSAQISTQDNAYWTYGYYEARIKAPRGYGSFPAFWMMPQFAEFGGWPDSGELDVFEHIGRDPTIVYAALHYKGDDWRGGFKYMPQSLAGAYHVYGFEWLPHRMRWFIDGKMYWEKTSWISPSPTRPIAPFDAPFYLILNLSVGGTWPHKPLPFPLTRFPMRFQIDYVRVYSIDGVADPRPRPAPAAGDMKACPLHGPGDARPPRVSPQTAQPVLSQ